MSIFRDKPGVFVAAAGAAQSAEQVDEEDIFEDDDFEEESGSDDFDDDDLFDDDELEEGSSDAEMSLDEAIAARSTNGDENFVLVGVIMGTHGLKGDVKVRCETDFPEQRFEQPGIRWMKRPGLRKQPFLPLKLLRGKRGPGKPVSWIVRFHGYDDVDKAKALCGVSLFVPDEDRPALDEDEFYSQDLIGLDVVLQETGETIGRVVDIVSGNAGEMLRVEITNEDPPPVLPASSKKKAKKPAEEGGYRRVWIPFVNPVVPVVDMGRRIVEITPPKGLLEVGKPSEEKIKKLLRMEEERKLRRFLRKASIVKRRFTVSNQAHVLEGLREGPSEARESFLKQLLSFDLRLLNRAIDETFLSDQNASSDSRVFPPPYFPAAFVSEDSKKAKSRQSEIDRWREAGSRAISDGKVAVVCVLARKLDSHAKSLLQKQAMAVLDAQTEASQSKSLASGIPWLIITNSANHEDIEEELKQNDCFGLRQSQVCLLKQGSLPCVSTQPINGNHLVLLETSHSVLSRPMGDGTVFDALFGSGMLRTLKAKGIAHLQFYADNNKAVKIADPVFFGYVSERGADIGVKVVNTLSQGADLPLLCVSEASPAGQEEGVEAEVAVENGNEEIGVQGGHYCVLSSFEVAARVEGIENSRAFKAGYINDSIMRISFVEKLACQRGFWMPFRRRAVEELNEGIERAEGATSFEKRIFDVFRYTGAENVAVLEVAPDELVYKGQL